MFTIKRETRIFKSIGLVETSGGFVALGICEKLIKLPGTKEVN
jgi:hypothetical protein